MDLPHPSEGVEVKPRVGELDRLRKSHGEGHAGPLDRRFKDLGEFRPGFQLFDDPLPEFSGNGGEVKLRCCEA